MANTITQIDLPGVTKLKSGKVREVFDLGDSLLFVATDRISAFDVILPNPIPEKGRVLTALSEFWFGKTQHIVENHFITGDFAGQSRRLPKSVAAARAASPGPLDARPQVPAAPRRMRRARLPRRFRVSRNTNNREPSAGSNCPRASSNPARSPNPSSRPRPRPRPATTRTSISTAVRDPRPTTRRESPRYLARPLQLRPRLRRHPRHHHRRYQVRVRAVGVRRLPAHSKLILIDEALTPDSSRFWPADGYAPGKPQPSFDKQFVRDYLETLDWDKTPPGPVLPDTVIRKTTEKYLEALPRFTA